MTQEYPMTRSHSRSHSDSFTLSGLVGSTVKSILVTAGVAAVANIGRKMIVQAPTAMSEDWFEGLAKEHQATLDVIDQMLQTSADHPQKRAMLLMNLKHMLAKHAMQEEHVIYPMLRREEDTETVDSLNSEHGEVKALLYELGEMDKSAPAFTETLEELREALEEHMREEEEVLFPALRKRLSDEENRKMSRSMNLAGFALA
jgi:iron-sulfur cluster repair protein YtfE (RIC family)